MTICAGCRRTIDREHSWVRLEAGITVDGHRLARDRNYCDLACWARHEATTELAEETQP